MYSFRVYFRDGNQKLFDAPDIFAVFEYLKDYLHVDTESVIKVEEV